MEWRAEFEAAGGPQSCSIAWSRRAPRSRGPGVLPLSNNGRSRGDMLCGPSVGNAEAIECTEYVCSVAPKSILPLSRRQLLGSAHIDSMLEPLKAAWWRLNRHCFRVSDSCSMVLEAVQAAVHCSG